MIIITMNEWMKSVKEREKTHTGYTKQRVIKLDSIED
jgi:hypothetical protein